MKISNIVISIFFITSNQFLIGQQDNSKTEEAFLNQIESTETPVSLGSNDNITNQALILQMGSGNYASIDQSTQGINLPGNIAELIQNGDVNNAVLTQFGNGNSHIINQSGNGNILEASVIGNNNSSTIDQLGNNNVINQDLVGNDMAFILSQIGNSNEISQVEIDYNPRQYEIRQEGDGMKVTIINGGIGSLIQIKK